MPIKQIPEKSIGIISIAEYNNNLSDAVNAIGTTPTTLFVNKPTEVKGNITTPTTLTVIVLKGGTINQSTYSITFNGPFDGGEGTTGRIFLGTGSIEINNPINMAWFGVSPSESAANNTTYGNDAINAIPATGQKIYYALIGTTQIDNYWELAISNTTINLGPGVTIQGTAATYLLFIHGTDRETRISNIRVNGGVFDGDSTASIGLVLQYIDNSIIEDVETNNFTSDGISWLGPTGSVAPTEYKNKIIRCKGTNNGAFGIIAGKQEAIEIAHCDYRSSGNSDYDIKNCAAINIHNNSSAGSVEHGINVRNSMYGVDTYGRIVNNEISNCGELGIWIHHDLIDAAPTELKPETTGELRDLIVLGNTVSGTTWSSISVSGSTSHIAQRISIVDNILNNSAIDGVQTSFLKKAIISDNIMDGLGRYGIIGGTQYSTIQDNVINLPIGYGIYLRDETDTTTYATYNTIKNNTIYGDENLLFGFIEPSSSNGDYNEYTGNKIHGVDPSLWYATHGVNDIVEINNYYSAVTDVSTSGTSISALGTFTLQETGPAAQFEIETYGTVTDVAGGNKTILFKGDGSTFLTIRAAANDNTDWFMRLKIDKYSNAGNNYFYSVSDDSGGWNHAIVSDNIGDAATIFTVTGECSSASDAVTLKSLKVKRIK